MSFIHSAPDHHLSHRRSLLEYLLASGIFTDVWSSQHAAGIASPLLLASLAYTQV